MSRWIDLTQMMPRYDVVVDLYVQSSAGGFRAPDMVWNGFVWHHERDELDTLGHLFGNKDDDPLLWPSHWMLRPAAPTNSRPFHALSFDQLRSANTTRQAEWPGSENADTAFRALEVAGEAGEVAEAVKKLLRERRGIAGTQGGVQAVAYELGDVVIACDLLASNLGIDLGESIVRKFNSTSNKYDLNTRI